MPLAFNRATRTSTHLRSRFVRPKMQIRRGINAIFRRIAVAHVGTMCQVSTTIIPGWQFRVSAGWQGTDESCEF